jgi:SGNH domain (fused to AT3 domains)
VAVTRAGAAATLRFHPRAARLRFGPTRWYVTSAGDRAPDAGAHTLRVGPLGEPACFGAAAAADRCANPALGRTVTPHPSDALLLPDAPCTPEHTRATVLEPCDFGDLDAPRPAAAALIGDSHAAHLRAAVEVVAQARGWRAVSLTHPGCAFSTEAYPAPPPIPQRCRAHGEQALRWLRAHPSVHVVFTSAAAGRGFSPAGFSAMWRRVPGSVRRIYVIRDVPRVPLATAGCVSAVIRRHARPAGACAVARAPLDDPEADAARVAGPRVRLIDLTRYFCRRSRCFPIVGNAYVYKDDNHINRVFATTLGPYLLRRL